MGRKRPTSISDPHIHIPTCESPLTCTCVHTPTWTQMHNIYTNRVTYVHMYKHKFYIHIAFHHYSGLNESHIPPSLAHLLECLVARGRTAREFLVGVGFFLKRYGLLEELCHWCWDLKSQRFMPFPCSSLSASCLRISSKFSGTAPVPCLHSPAILSAHEGHSHLLKIQNPKKLFLLQVPYVMVSNHCNNNNNNNM